MTNKWIEHVKSFAKKNNLSYSCALSHPNLKDGYVKVIKKSKKEINDEKVKIMIAQNIELLKNTIKDMDPDDKDDKTRIRMKVNGYNKQVQDGLKEKYPRYYKKLFD